MPTGGERAIRVGCSGWNYASWKDAFYGGRPARLWLEHYARHFDTVEVNSTFYRLPRESAVANWVAESPPGFLFAVKMSRWVTHIRRLNDVPLGLERFYDSIAPLDVGARSRVVAAGTPELCQKLAAALSA